MIEKKPKTYNEIIRLKKCYTLANYYSDITENMFNSQVTQRQGRLPSTCR